MSNPSTIAIEHTNSEGTTDIAGYVVFAQTRFSLSGSGMPATGTLVVRDEDRELSFITGDEIVVVVDGVRLWGGLIMDVAQGLFFPVVDTTDLDLVRARQWVLTCTDFNIYMQKRVIRNTADYLNPIRVGPGLLGDIIRASIPLYMDVPPGFDYTTKVEDTNYTWQGADNNGEPNGLAAPLDNQGVYWKQQLDEMARLGGFEWRVDANKRLHFHTLENLIAPWAFTDRFPTGTTTIGFREGTVREDGMQMVTDALVWGGSALLSGDLTIFARYPDPPANTENLGTAANPVIITADTETDALARIDTYGRWQRSEMHSGDPRYFLRNSVKYRAYVIVAGPQGMQESINVDGGLNHPVWQVSLSWFAHRVPGKQHIFPGHITTMLFWALGDDTMPLPLTLPLRSLEITFPTIPSDNPDADPLTYVRFDGEFGIAASDSRFLWRFLQQRQGIPESFTVPGTADNDSTTTTLGAVGGFTPVEEPNGLRTVFTLPFSYIAGSTKVYLNALLQRPRIEYEETDPATGEIEFNTAPYADDSIWVECRTGAT